MDKKIYMSILAAAATLAAIGLFVLLAAPVAKPMAWALIIGIATMPHYNRILSKLPGYPGYSAGLMVLAITICFILPIALLVITVATNATDWYSEVEQIVATITKSGAGRLSHYPLVVKLITIGDKFGLDLLGSWEKFAAGSSNFLLNMATNVAINLFDLLFTLAAALFILFFIYRDGERVVTTCIDQFASNPQRARWYATEIYSITTAVTVGTIFTCFVQGVTAGLGYYVADLPAPVFCGALTAVAALVPVVGTGVVWVPLVLLLVFNGAYLSAGLLALWCILFVGFADNAIRPLAIGAASNISTLPIVLGAICGVLTIGLLGLILGPVVFAILMTLWKEAIAVVVPLDYAGERTQPPE